MSKKSDRPVGIVSYDEKPDVGHRNDDARSAGGGWRACDLRARYTLFKTKKAQQAIGERGRYLLVDAFPSAAFSDWALASS